MNTTQALDALVREIDELNELGDRIGKNNSAITKATESYHDPFKSIRENRLLWGGNATSDLRTHTVLVQYWDSLKGDTDSKYRDFEKFLENTNKVDESIKAIVRTKIAGAKESKESLVGLIETHGSLEQDFNWHMPNLRRIAEALTKGKFVFTYEPKKTYDKNGWLDYAVYKIEILIQEPLIDFIKGLVEVMENRGYTNYELDLRRSTDTAFTGWLTSQQLPKDQIRDRCVAFGCEGVDTIFRSQGKSSIRADFNQRGDNTLYDLDLYLRAGLGIGLGGGTNVRVHRQFIELLCEAYGK